MEQSPAPKPAPEQKRRSNTALLALVVLLLISNVLMLWLYMQEKGERETAQTQVTTVTSEKENVTKLLEDMLTQYDTLNTENEQLQTEMEAQKEKIEGLLADVKSGKADLFKAKKEAETLRKIMKGYVVTIDSLRQANVELLAAKTATEQQLGEVSAQKQALESKSQEQEATIARGSVLSTTSISANAVFLRSNGKQVDTPRASKAEMVKCCFTLGENRITQPGNKTMYMRIISPDGQVLPASDANNRFPVQRGGG
jgi:seryl-tRNA synthetase